MRADAVVGIYGKRFFVAVLREELGQAPSVGAYRLQPAW